jgi:hypothetical protein
MEDVRNGNKMFVGEIRGKVSFGENADVDWRNAFN